MAKHFQKIGKLQSGIGALNDNDELMKQLNFLMKEKKKLSDKLSDLKFECEIFKEILGSSVPEDIADIAEDFLPKLRTQPLLNEEEENSLISHSNLLKNVKLQQILGITARRARGKILVEFIHPVNYKPSILFYLILETDNFRLLHSSLPPIVPLQELEKEWLTEKKDIPFFIYKIHHYIQCYWRRDFEVQIIKKQPYMKQSCVYHNKDRTIISFTLKLQNNVTVEIQLRFSPLSFIPDSVDYINTASGPLDMRTRDALDELKASLLEQPLSLVLNVNLADDESQESESGSGTGSESTTLFEMFR